MLRVVSKIFIHTSMVHVIRGLGLRREVRVCRELFWGVDHRRLHHRRLSIDILFTKRFKDSREHSYVEIKRSLCEMNQKALFYHFSFLQAKRRFSYTLTNGNTESHWHRSSNIYNLKNSLEYFQLLLIIFSEIHKKFSSRGSGLCS